MINLTINQPYKIIEEEVNDVNDIKERTLTLLIDLTGLPAQSVQVFEGIKPQLEDAERISFISLYHQQVAPQSFYGLAIVKWLTPESEEADLSEYCYPLVVATRPHPTNEFGDVLEQYIENKVQSLQVVRDVAKEVFDD